MIKETVGSQDQVLVAFGGLNHIVFSPGGEISIRPVTVSSERLQELNSHLMLFYTGIERTASDIAESYVADVDGKKSQLRIMKHLVEESLSILNNGRDLSAFGALMHEGWQAKRSLSARVSNSRVDEIYAHAMSKGALGGKLLGAGGGGFMLLFVPPERQDRIREVLKQFIYVPIRFEFAGSQIIFFDPEREYSAEEKMRSLQEFSFSGELTEELFGERAATIEAEYLKER
jgi:D-glycero-alpha-D-manno-heptose-7-phosphate kinase